MDDWIELDGIIFGGIVTVIIVAILFVGTYLIALIG